uniref:Reverse transcriptase n=1 Tax=Cannabis sativa TaxID=3483 RepID=A0A803Q8V3_CANSA
MDSLLYKQEVFWKQRSRENWLKIGDKNTKFFYHKATARKCNNLIRTLTLDDGSTVTDQTSIMKNFMEFYSNLFTSQVEGLSAAIRLKETSKDYSEIPIYRDAHAISHILFVDDNLLFTKINSRVYFVIMDILNMYHRATGQLVNFTKLAILFSPNTTLREKDLFFSHLDLGNVNFASRYLGVPQYSGKFNNFHYLVRNVSAKMNNWNGIFFQGMAKKPLLKLWSRLSHPMLCPDLKSPCPLAKKLKALLPTSGGVPKITTAKFIGNPSPSFVILNSLVA